MKKVNFICTYLLKSIIALCALKKKVTCGTLEKERAIRKVCAIENCFNYQELPVSGFKFKTKTNFKTSIFFPLIVPLFLIMWDISFKPFFAVSSNFPPSS